MRWTNRHKYAGADVDRDNSRVKAVNLPTDLVTRVVSGLVNETSSTQLIVQSSVMKLIFCNAPSSRSLLGTLQSWRHRFLIVAAAAAAASSAFRWRFVTLRYAVDWLIRDSVTGVYLLPAAAPAVTVSQFIERCRGTSSLAAPGQG